ncbi:hypothetical protein L1987_56849 [Smallanthus sonchifolius]|uniref:Uncharacterized protein n=1 Tax=Smallanthus sonchifolius TaxID=185202 RepID=A0ACB9DAX6_9ASTR|nr:hypothetical protein L1987_56849 [Smallanthus sonchifolius]
MMNLVTNNDGTIDLYDCDICSLIIYTRMILIGIGYILADCYACGTGFADAETPTMGSNRSWKSMEMEIQSLLEKLLDVNDSMSRCAASATPTTSVTQKLARHRDILHEFSQMDYTRNKVKSYFEIFSTSTAITTLERASGSPRMQILRERAAIHGSIAHAQTTRAALGSQRAMFGDVQGKVKQLSDKFPIVRGLIGITLLLSSFVLQCC